MGVTIIKKNTTLTRLSTSRAIIRVAKNGTMRFNNAATKNGGFTDKIKVVFGQMDDILKTYVIGKTIDNEDGFCIRGQSENRSVITCRSLALEFHKYFKPKTESFYLEIDLTKPIVEHGCTFYRLVLVSDL